MRQEFERVSQAIEIGDIREAEKIGMLRKACVPIVHAEESGK